MIDHIKTGSRILFLMIITSVLYAYAMFQGAFVSWFLFYSFLSVFIVEMLFFFYPIRYWQASRVVHNDVVRAGEDVIVQLTVGRRIPFPILYCIVEEVFTPSLTNLSQHVQSSFNEKEEKRRMKRLIHPLFKRRFTVKYTLKDVPRGEHEWIGLRIQTGSFFGFLKKDYLIRTEGSFVVYPNHFPIRLTEQSGLQMNEEKLSSVPFFSNKLNVAPTVREFSPGDKISWIDWKQTAKTTKLMTREFENEKKTEVLIIFDYTYNDLLDIATFESSIEYALSLFHYMDEKQIDTRFLAIGKKLTMFDDRRISSEQIENYLVQIKPAKTGVATHHIIEEIAKQSRLEQVLFVTTQIDQHFIQNLQGNIRHGSKLTIFLIKRTSEQTKSEQGNIVKLQGKGIAIQIVDEKVLSDIPVEVKL